jgi:hypothetical protein
VRSWAGEATVLEQLTRWLSGRPGDGLGAAPRAEHVERVATRDLGVGEARGTHAESLLGLAHALLEHERLQAVAKAKLGRSAGVVAVTDARVLFCAGPRLVFEVPLSRIIAVETSGWPRYGVTLRYAGGPTAFEEVQPEHARKEVARVAGAPAPDG